MMAWAGSKSHQLTVSAGGVWESLVQPGRDRAGRLGPCEAALAGAGLLLPVAVQRGWGGSALPPRWLPDVGRQTGGMGRGESRAVRSRGWKEVMEKPRGFAEDMRSTGDRREPFVCTLCLHGKWCLIPIPPSIHNKSSANRNVDS